MVKAKVRTDMIIMNKQINHEKIVALWGVGDNKGFAPKTSKNFIKLAIFPQIVDLSPKLLLVLLYFSSFILSFIFFSALSEPFIAKATSLF